MREVGFEPTKALSHRILSPAPLTTRELPHKNMIIVKFKNVFELSKHINKNNFLSQKRRYVIQNNSANARKTKKRN